MKRHIINRHICLLALTLCVSLGVILLPACSSTAKTSTLSSITSIPTSVPTQITTPFVTATTSTTTAGPTTTLSTAYPIISAASDGQTIRFNVVKFTGTSPSPGAAVSVDDIQATVDSLGNYYAYLDLSKGQNIIEIGTTLNGKTSTDKITVTYLPPLVIFLNEPVISANTDYTKTPLTVTGLPGRWIPSFFIRA